MAVTGLGTGAVLRAVAVTTRSIVETIVVSRDVLCFGTVAVEPVLHVYIVLPPEEILNLLETVVLRIG